MSGARQHAKPVILVVDDLRESFDTLVRRAGEYESGRLLGEFDFEYVDSFPELKDWYIRNRGRFVSLIVQDVDFSHTPDERRLVSYPESLRPLQQPVDNRALQGFLIYGYLRQLDIDRVVPVVFVSCRVGMESMSEMTEFLVNPGHAGCTFVPETDSGDAFYPSILKTIDGYALRPLDAAARARWADEHHMVVGRARKMAFLAYEIEKVGAADATVLLIGRPGVGKELVANALHRHSSRYVAGDRRREYPCTVNIAAIDNNLVEDELFGHEHGAFTGSTGERAGIFEAADGSTVFLDEIGEVGKDIQVKLLRTMEYHRIKRLGSSHEIEVDMRVIATTNRTVEEMQTACRPDFYYRLVQHCIAVPSLHERWVGEPVAVLRSDLDDFFAFALEMMNRNPRHRRRLGIDKAAVSFVYQTVEQYLDGANTLFAGNMRTLRNVVDRAYERAQYDGSTNIGLGHIMPTFGVIRLMNAQAPVRTSSGTIESIAGTLNLAAVERKAIAEALAKTEGNQSQAADLLGIHRDTLRRKITSETT